MANPSEKLQNISAKNNLPLASKEFAQFMDRNDPLSESRNKFHCPKLSSLRGVDQSLVHSDYQEVIYMCSHELGLMPRGVTNYLDFVSETWAKKGAFGHFSGVLPWAKCDEKVNADCAQLVGAKTDEVAIMNACTVNLHLLFVAFYQPKQSRRFKILIDKSYFQSRDHAPYESQARLRGFVPEDVVVQLEPRIGETTLRTEDIIEKIEKEGEQIAVVCLSGVQPYTGQLLDIEAITKAGHSQGCHVGWNLGHAVGNVELQLNQWKVDFAFWPSYRYLNSGAGAMAGAFLHERHNVGEFTKLQGWWSHRIATRFDMTNKMDESSGISAFRLTNPSIFLTACLRASLDIFRDAGGMKPLREKSLLLTAYLEHLIVRNLDAGRDNDANIRIITPENPCKRGAQLSVEFCSHSVEEVNDQLRKRGVVCDVINGSKVLRVTPAPLYNTYLEVFRFVEVLEEVLRR